MNQDVGQTLHELPRRLADVVAKRAARQCRELHILNTAVYVDRIWWSRPARVKIWHFFSFFVHKFQEYNSHISCNWFGVLVYFISQEKHCDNSLQTFGILFQTRQMKRSRWRVYVEYKNAMKDSCSSSGLLQKFSPPTICSRPKDYVGKMWKAKHI